MSGWYDSIRSWPWAWGWLTFFVIVTVRAGATYAIGRAVAAGLMHRRAPGPKVLAAMDRVDRWGAPAVTVSFLTVGVQTAVNLGAGLVRMSMPRYLLGLVPGAVLWATIWTTVGAGAVHLVRHAGDDPVLVGLVVGVVCAVVGLTALMARRPLCQNKRLGRASSGAER